MIKPTLNLFGPQFCLMILNCRNYFDELSWCGPELRQMDRIRLVAELQPLESCGWVKLDLS